MDRSFFKVWLVFHKFHHFEVQKLVMVTQQYISIDNLVRFLTFVHCKKDSIFVDLVAANASLFDSNSSTLANHVI